MKMGGRIAQRLAELGWTQVDLLNRVDGLNVGTLSAMILRDSQRSQHSEAIARALGVAHAWLQTGDGPMVPPAVNQKVDIAPAMAVGELIAKPGARIRYTTVQNWSQNVFNLVTKRAVAQERATVEWVDCNLGSKLTMKYLKLQKNHRAN